MSEEWKRTIPAGDGKSTYILHKIKGKYYWYIHYHDPTIGKTKTKRQDPPGLDLIGLPHEPTPLEVIKEYLATQVTQVTQNTKDLEAPESRLQAILPPEISQEIDIVIEELEDRAVALTKSKRPKDVRTINKAIGLIEKFKQAL